MILSLSVISGEFVPNYQSARGSLWYFMSVFCLSDEHLCDVIILRLAHCFVYFKISKKISKTYGKQSRNSLHGNLSRQFLNLTLDFK